MHNERVVVIGGGVAGVAAALTLAGRGIKVTLLERASRPGGKMREVMVDGHAIDSGPTVFTMRWVFDELFATLGERFEDHVTLRKLDTLARHAWQDGSRLDLFADPARTVDAIAEFSGARNAAGYDRFRHDAKKIYDVLKQPFICNPEPSMTALMRGAGFRELFAIKPFQTMWKALGEYFSDPRLQQLFGRYATYCGSSPFDAPATLMLVAHVESEGVWTIEGGMYRLALALTDLAIKRGVDVRYDSEVDQIEVAHGRISGVKLANGERIDADAVIATADVSALGGGMFGRAPAKAVNAISPSARSLSAMTWSGTAQANGFPLHRHSVFFSRDYHAEFDDIFEHRRMPQEPTVYICAQDRGDDATSTIEHERLLILINAPPIGERHVFHATEIEQCAQRTFSLLQRCGLTLQSTQLQATTPTDFNRMFPATGGALYGRSSHGWTASFQRAGARTKLPGLYLAGGSAHPGPGVPMATLSGRMAAASLIADLNSTARSRTTATHGGTSMR